MNIEITMKYKKSTKGTHVFEEVVDTDVPWSIPTLYIRKTALKEPAQEIKVTVEVIK